jgi:hypothetical protein
MLLNTDSCCPNSAWDYDPASSLVYWQPNQTFFERTDAKASIFFLDANLMGYLEPTLDPIFHANPQDEGDMLDGVSIPVYRQTRLITILGCVEEYEICNPAVASSSSSSSRSCLPITPGIQNYANISNALRLSPIQSATLVRLAAVLKNRNMASAAHHIGSNSLLASKTFQGGMQYASLPVDQWRAEVGRWFSITLALLQQGFVSLVTAGPQTNSSTNTTTTTTRQAAVKSMTLDPGQLMLCERQRVRNPAGVQNFDFTAVLVVICAGIAINAVGLGLDTMVGWFQARKGDVHGRRRRWVFDGLFQLQRLAYNAVEKRCWLDLDEDIPTTVGVFAPLSEVDLDLFIESHAEPSPGLEMESNPNGAAAC